MTRPIIVHCHIFKNAGSTVIEAFRRNFPGRVAELEPEDPDGLLAHEKLDAFVSANPEAVLVSSHRARLPLPETLGGRRVIPLVLLRHPIDRLGSVYRFERTAGGRGAIGVLARRTGMDVFFDTLLNTGLGGLVSNVQASFCGATGENSAHDIFAHLKRSPMIGTVERYAESMGLIEQVLREWYPQCNLAGFTENMTRKPTTLNQDLRRTVLEMGECAFQRLQEINTTDLALYRFVDEELTRRRSNPVVAQALENFIERDKIRRVGRKVKLKRRLSQIGAYVVSPLNPLWKWLAEVRRRREHFQRERARLERARLEAPTPIDLPINMSVSSIPILDQAVRWQLIDPPIKSRRTRISAVRILVEEPAKLPMVVSGARLCLELRVEKLKGVPCPLVCITFKDRFGNVAFRKYIPSPEKLVPGKASALTRVCRFFLTAPELAEGIYMVEVAIGKGSPSDMRTLTNETEALALGISPNNLQ